MTAIWIALIAACGLVAILVDRARRAERRRAAKLAADLEHLQRSFGRFVPPAVVDEITVTGVRHLAEKRQVTVMFADLRGFTALSETHAAELLVEILNGYFEEMSVAITAHQGTVSKFIGDGLMATFGAIVPNPWQARDAVEAALAMRAALARYNETLRATGRPELAFGIGIHGGVAIAGVIGSARLVDLTVIGDVVNTAARVEALTRSHGVDILITDAVKQGLDERIILDEMPAAELKGKREPMITWSVRAIARG
jgi:class 3 adenylate cyclase